jgi:hypothetical protein
MEIYLSTGIGEGPTPLAAFDAALNAGIANYNLIVLSSVIPARSVMRRAKFVAIAFFWSWRDTKSNSQAGVPGRDWAGHRNRAAGSHCLSKCTVQIVTRFGATYT